MSYLLILGGHSWPLGSLQANAQAARGRNLVLSNVTLTVAKLIVASSRTPVSVLSRGTALRARPAGGADGVASPSGSRASRPTADHMFGHGKFESISGLLEGLLILVAVVLIVWGAVGRIVTGSPRCGSRDGASRHGRLGGHQHPGVPHAVPRAKQTDSVALRPTRGI